MRLGVGRDLLSCCARLQPCSTLEADAGVSRGPSAWQKGARGQPLRHLHGNWCLWGRTALGAAVLGSSISELPGPWALHFSVLWRSGLCGEATGSAEANAAKHQACTCLDPPLPEPYHGPGSHVSSQGDPSRDAPRAAAPVGQHGAMAAPACPPGHTQTLLPAQPERPMQRGRARGCLTPARSQQSGSSAPEGPRDAAQCQFITYPAPRPDGLSRPPSHAAPAPRPPGGCSSPPVGLGCPPGLPQSPSLWNWRSPAWAAPLCA